MSWPPTCAPRAIGKHLLHYCLLVTTTMYYFLYFPTRLESLLAAGLREAGLGEVRRNGPLREEHRLPNTLSLGIRGVRCAGMLLTYGLLLLAAAHYFLPLLTTTHFLPLLTTNRASELLAALSEDVAASAGTAPGGKPCPSTRDRHAWSQLAPTAQWVGLEMLLACGGRHA